MAHAGSGGAGMIGLSFVKKFHQKRRAITNTLSHEMDYAFRRTL